MTTGCTSPTTFQKHDDQATNSLGHTRSTLRGKDIVIIPGERIGKIHRSSALMVDISQMIVDEDSGLTGEGELERLQSGIFRGFTAAATGMRLNSMFAPLCQPSSSPAGLQLHAGSSAMPLSSVALSQFGGDILPASAREVPKNIKTEPVEPSAASFQVVEQGVPRGKRRGGAMPADSLAGKQQRGAAVALASFPQSSAGFAPGGSQGAQCRSRPPRGLCEVADGTLAALPFAGPQDQKFYGSGTATTLKFMQRIPDDLAAHVAKISDEATVEVASSRLRLLSSELEVHTIFLSTGSEHADFAVAMDSQAHVHSLPPTLSDCRRWTFRSRMCLLSNSICWWTSWLHSQRHGRAAWPPPCPDSLMSGICREARWALQVLCWQQDRWCRSSRVVHSLHQHGLTRHCASRRNPLSVIHCMPYFSSRGGVPFLNSVRDASTEEKLVAQQVTKWSTVLQETRYLVQGIHTSGETTSEVVAAIASSVASLNAFFKDCTTLVVQGTIAAIATTVKDTMGMVSVVCLYFYFLFGSKRGQAMASLWLMKRSSSSRMPCSQH